MDSSSERSSASTFASSALASSKNGSPFGQILWCGPGEGKALSGKFMKYSISSMDHGHPGVVICQPEELKKMIMEIPFVVAIVMVGHTGSVVRETFAHVRSQCYSLGLGCPVYAATTNSSPEVSRLYEVADVVSTSVNELTSMLQTKFDASQDLTEMVWCDPLYQSSLMRSKVRELEAFGVHVTLCGTEDDLLRETTASTLAVVVTGRTVGAIRKIREKLCNESTRPLFWIVSLSANLADSYRAGLDAAIVKENSALDLHKQHILAKNPNDSWMWTVVVGDIKSNIIRKGLAGIGGTHWSLPKHFDSTTWLNTRSNFRCFIKKADTLFRQVASHHEILVESIIPLQVESDAWTRHQSKFMAAKSQLPSYVGDGLCFHGTSVEVANAIMQTGFKSSTSGMYGPGVYAVDAVGLGKALFFAMTKSKAVDSQDRSARVDRCRGAVLAMRFGFNEVCSVPELPDGWYHTRKPSNTADTVLGTAPKGYSGLKGFWTKKDEDLDNIPEYVISNPHLVMPLFVAIYTK